MSGGGTLVGDRGGVTIKRLDRCGRSGNGARNFSNGWRSGGDSQTGVPAPSRVAATLCFRTPASALPGTATTADLNGWPRTATMAGPPHTVQTTTADRTATARQNQTGRPSDRDPLAQQARGIASRPLNSRPPTMWEYHHEEPVPHGPTTVQMYKKAPT